MPRIRVTRKFLKSRQKLSGSLQKATDRAIKKFISTPDLPGLNFEAIRGHPGYYSIRVSRGHRIFLREDRDEDGPVFTVVDVQPHDGYRRL